MTLTPPVAGAIPFADFSSHNEDAQHQIDWPTFAQFWLALHPEAGAIVKCSQGDWYVSPRLDNQRLGAHAAGIINVGLYHYVELVSGKTGLNLTGAQNADFLMQTVGAHGGILPREFYAGDWEDQSAGPNADLDACALDFGGRILRPAGVPPMFYSAKWFADPHDLNRDPALAQFPLWWASYQNTMPPVPEPWASQGKGIALWQFTASAMLPGVPFPVDVSWWLAGLPALRAIQWGVQPSPFPPGPIDVAPDVPGIDESHITADYPARIYTQMAADAAKLADALTDPALRQQALVLKADADLGLRCVAFH